MLIFAESSLDTSNGIGSKVVVGNLFGLAKQISVEGLCGHFLVYCKEWEKMKCIVLGTIL